MKTRGTSNVVDRYARSLKRHKVLTKEAELELARRYRRGDAAAGQQLVEGNLRYAMKVAHQYRNYGHPIEDLVQEANIGLMRALVNFDPTRGYRFITYANWWIRATLNMYVTRQVSIVAFGTTKLQRECFAKVGPLVHRLEREHPRATRAEIFTRAGRELHASAEEVELMYTRTRGGSDLSLDAPLVSSDGDSFAHLDMLADARDLPDALAQEHEAVTSARGSFAVARSVARSPREAYIIEKRLIADEPLTLQAIGERFGSISRERVRQLETSLRKRIAAVL